MLPCFFLGENSPWKINMDLQITRLERKMIFQTSMIMFHVNLPGCFCWSHGCGFWVTIYKVYIYLFELLLRIVVERPFFHRYVVGFRRPRFDGSRVFPPKKTEAGGKKTSGYDKSSYIFITHMIWIDILFTKLQSYGIAVMPWSSSSHIFKWGYGPPKRIICRFHETILRWWLHL